MLRHTPIRGLCEEDRLLDAKELFVIMEQNGCLRNEVTYNTIIRGFLGQCKCYESLLLLEEMTGKGFDASTSSLIVDQILTKGQDPAIQEKDKVLPKDGALNARGVCIKFLSHEGKPTLYGAHSLGYHCHQNNIVCHKLKLSCLFVCVTLGFHTLNFLPLHFKP